MLATLSNNSLYRNTQIIMQNYYAKRSNIGRLIPILYSYPFELLMWGRSEARHRNGLQV